MTLETLYNRDLVTEELVRARFEMSSGTRFQAQLARRTAPPQRSIVDELPRLAPQDADPLGQERRERAVERALLLFDLIPGAELHIFDECGHWVQWDQAARFNQIVGDFLPAPSAYDPPATA